MALAPGLAYDVVVVAENEIASGRARCRIHDIAMGNDGRCVLCRRAKGEVPSEPTSPWPAIGLFVLLSIVALGAYALSRGSQQTQLAADNAVLPPVVAEPVVPEPLAAPEQPEAEPQPNILERRAALRKEREERKELLASEMKRVAITMFSTTWCKQCTRARKWLDDNGYTYTDHDVEADGRYARMRDRLTPRKGVPTLKIGEVVLVGFSAKAVEQAIRSEAEKRLP